jgi:hypothetical protein
MSYSKRRRRPLTIGASTAAILTTTLLFGMFPVPVAGATSSISSSSVTASPEPVASSSSSGEVDPSQVKITEEEAVAKVRALFPALKDAQLGGTSLTNGRNSGQGYDGQLIWEISWSVQRGNSSSGFSSRVDAVSGDLLSLGVPSNLFSEPVVYPPKVTRKQALELAHQFIGKAVPSVQSHTLKESTSYFGGGAITPFFGPVLYRFALQTTHEGIDIQGQTVQITVSGNGNVTEFYFMGNHAPYPSSKPKLSLEEARKKWEQDLKMNLVYVPTDYRGNQEPKEWKLVYSPEFSMNRLDAQTGQWTTEGFGQETILSQPYEYLPLTAKGEPYKTHPVTAEEAIQSVAAVADIPKGYTIQSKQLNKGRNGEHDTWQLRWGNDNNGFFDGRSAQVDAETGLLLNFYTDRYGPPKANADEASEPPSLPKDKAVQIADEWVVKHIPDAASYKRLNPKEWTADTGTGYVTLTYQRFYKDLMLQSSNVTVTLNSEGRLVGLYASTGLGSTEPLDKLKAAFTAEEAKSKVLAATDMRLTYVRSGGYNIGPSGKYVPVTMTLAYVPMDREHEEPFYRMFNAVGGELFYPYGLQNGTTTGVKPSDIQSHWASSALQAAIDHGVLIPDAEGKVFPNKTITNGDFIRLVSLAMDPNAEIYNYYGASLEKPYADVDDQSPYYVAVNYWIGRGWLMGNPNVKLNPNAVLTREQLADDLAKITGYEKLAAKLGGDSSVTGLKDSKSITKPGAVALALKLGLMNAADGLFRPQVEVTVGEATAILLRLAQIQSELDRPLSS